MLVRMHPLDTTLHISEQMYHTHNAEQDWEVSLDHLILLYIFFRLVKVVKHAKNIWRVTI